MLVKIWAWSFVMALALAGDSLVRMGEASSGRKLGKFKDEIPAASQTSQGSAKNIGHGVLGLQPQCEKGPMCSTFRGSDGEVKGVVFGGQVGLTRMRNDTWILEPADGSWQWRYITDTSTESAGPSSRWKGALVTVDPALKASGSNVVGQSLFLVGGSDGYGPTEKFFSDIWKIEYAHLETGLAKWMLVADGTEGDVKSGKWPAARRAHAAISYENKIIVHGGKDSNGKVLGDTWQYDVNSGKFSEIHTSGGPASRKGHSACLFTGQRTAFTSKWSSRWGSKAHTASMIVFGGRENSRVYMNDVYALTLDGTATWVLLESGGAPQDGKGNLVRPSRRNHHSAVLKDEIMYVFGGRSSHDSVLVHDDLWMFNVIEAKWTRIKFDTYPDNLYVPGRMEHCSILMSHRLMLTFGGQDGSGNRRNDVWSYSLEFNQFQREIANTCQSSMPRSALWISLTVLFFGVVILAFKLQHFKPYMEGYTSI